MMVLVVGCSLNMDH